MSNQEIMDNLFGFPAAIPPPVLNDTDYDEHYDEIILNETYSIKPKEPIYDRSKMDYFLEFPFHLDLYAYLAYTAGEAGFMQDTANAILFTHTTSIDTGGLAKEWFSQKYTSNAVINFISRRLTARFMDAVYAVHSELTKCMTQLLILGYINFRWLYLSNDLLDILYIVRTLFLKLQYDAYSSKAVESIQLFNAYINNLITDETNSTITITNSDIQQLEIIKYMQNKVENQCNVNDNHVQTNFINRNHLIVYLYYKLFENERDDNTKNYYLLKIVTTLYQSIDKFTKEIEYINETSNSDISLNIDTTDNLLIALKARISNEIDFDELININEEIYNILSEFMPTTEAIARKYERSRTDNYPYFFNDPHKHMLYAHLINENEIVDIEKLINNITFEDNATLNFAVEEKNKLYDTFRSMTNEEAINFLKFVTGTDRIPSSILFVKTYGQLSAHTCSNQIDIPNEFLLDNDIESIKIALTTEITDNEYTLAGGANDAPNTFTTFILVGVIVLASILQVF